MQWRGKLDRIWPSWRKFAASKGIAFLEWLTMDSELILDVQAEAYEQTAKKFHLEADKDGKNADTNRMIAHIYDGVAEGLHHLAMDVYVSFK